MSKKSAHNRYLEKKKKRSSIKRLLKNALRARWTEVKVKSEMSRGEGASRVPIREEDPSPEEEKRDRLKERASEDLEQAGPGNNTKNSHVQERQGKKGVLE